MRDFARVNELILGRDFDIILTWIQKPVGYLLMKNSDRRRQKLPDVRF